jgi:hypothetical protein
MRNSMERNGNLHRGHDGQRWRRKLRRQLLDPKSKSLDEQWRSRQRRTLDRYDSVFDMFGCASDSKWIGSVGDDQLEHEPGLECGHSARGMQCQLQSVAEFSLDCIPNHNV